jgi:nucleoside-diphosphate-sugar epimerase
VLLNADKEKIAGKIFNAGYENQPVSKIAETVKNVVGEDVKLITTPSDDNRSYHISSQKIKDEIGFETTHTIQDAVEDLCAAFDKGLLPNSLEDEMYFNIKRMQNVELT